MSISFVHNHPSSSQFIPIFFFNLTKLMFCGLIKIEFHFFYNPHYTTELNVPVMKILLLVNIDKTRKTDYIALTVF